jgi:hypothetical protein|tara:strand:- start:1027 stop:1257 length:231 start_codon:yes stop_codon:yes gene_type:complete
MSAYTFKIKGEKMINKVTKKQIDDAFDYFMDTGRLEELKSDDVYYIQALLKHIANEQNIKLVFEDNEAFSIFEAEE